jgi:hypothetical protein
MLSNRLENGGGLVGVVSREHCGMTAKGFVQRASISQKCSPQTSMAPQAAKNAKTTKGSRENECPSQDLAP